MKFINKLKCKLGFHQYHNLLFVTMCIRCPKLDESHNHKTAIDFLIQRYTNPTDKNQPGKDFTVEEVLKPK